MISVRTTLGVAVGATLLVATAACGDNGDDPASGDAPEQTSAADPSTGTDATSALPACDSVWKEDADLPKPYDGCAEADTTVAPDLLECSSGQRIVLYDDHYWALPGHIIGYAPEGLDEDKRYARVLYSCRA
jgi:hypothetical protein